MINKFQIFQHILFNLSRLSRSTAKIFLIGLKKGLNEKERFVCFYIFTFQGLGFKGIKARILRLYWKLHFISDSLIMLPQKEDLSFPKGKLVLLGQVLFTATESPKTPLPLYTGMWISFWKLLPHSRQDWYLTSPVCMSTRSKRHHISQSPAIRR